MERKQITDAAFNKISGNSPRLRVILLTSLLCAGWLASALAEDADGPAFIGSPGCSSSSCHGGGGASHSEFTQWRKSDFHHERPFATLTTARASRIADNLKISDPTRDAHCTSCHAPLQTVPAAILGRDNQITEGVSCENCHAPAANWLRSHTRKDYTTADRVQTGMRDLKNLYVRANTCVACHQNVDPETLAAGHPELVFELDGQQCNEPRHWPKAQEKPGPQIWLVGQAVALREISWQLAGEKKPETTLRDQCEGLLRLLQPICSIQSDLPPFDKNFLAANGVDWSAVQHWSDDFAKAASNLTWSTNMTRQCLATLTGASEPFVSKLPASAQARYAERLVLGLDRLMTSVGPLYADAKLNESMNHLFSDVQSLPDFSTAPFVTDLNQFRQNLAAASR